MRHVIAEVYQKVSNGYPLLFSMKKYKMKQKYNLKNEKIKKKRERRKRGNDTKLPHLL